MLDIYAGNLDVRRLKFGKVSEKNYGNKSRSGKVLILDLFNRYRVY